MGCSESRAGSGSERSGRLALLLASAALIVAGNAHAAGFGGLLGGGFKAEFYPECHAPLAAAREVLPPPPADYGAKAQAAGQMAGAVGRIPGLGGLGALGSVGSAASTAAQVATYSNWIADAAEFTASMRTEYPELTGRFGAYGARIDSDADELRQAGRAAVAAQQCYGEAYDSLVADIASGEVKRRERNKRHGEITEGLDQASELLIDARNRMNGNIRAYNDALSEDSTQSGLGLTSLVGIAARNGLAEKALGNLMEDAGVQVCDSFDANCARRQAAIRARNAGGFAGLYTDADPVGAQVPDYGIAQDLAVNAAVYSGNGIAAASALGAAGAATTMVSSYSVLTSDNRQAPECAGLDDGAALYACLNGKEVAADGSVEGYVLDDLALLGLTSAAPGGAVAAAGLLGGAVRAGGGAAMVDDGALEQLLRTGEVSSEYLAINRGLNAADRSQAEVVARVGVRPW